MHDLLEQFERERPEHPLVAVFKPLLTDDLDRLEREAVHHYRKIKSSDLDATCKATLLDVFTSWLEQRLTQKSKKEIETMLLGELPDLEETQSGKDLIRIGEERGQRIGEERGQRIGEERGQRAGEERGLRAGEERGLRKAIQVSLRARYGSIPTAVQDQLQALTAEEAERLLSYLPQCATLDDLMQWLAGPRTVS